MGAKNLSKTMESPVRFLLLRIPHIVYQDADRVEIH